MMDGMQLSELRKRSGKTQLQAARDLGTSVSTLNRHEHGKTPLSNYHRTTYGVYYGVDPSAIKQPVQRERSAA